MSFMQDIVSKFNQQADSHSKSQSLNPFSDQFVQSRSPSPRFSREEYGKPVAGSKTDLRGRKAKTHICREILELCTVIHDVGTYNARKRAPDDDDEDDIEDDGTIIVSFGELFQIYTKISDKVVGLLIAAKRRGFVYFDREILFQRRDDDVLIALLKPISEIQKLLNEDINQANGVPAAVESKPAEKKKSTKTKRTKPEKSAEEPKIMVSIINGTDENATGFGIDDVQSDFGEEIEETTSIGEPDCGVVADTTSIEESDGEVVAESTPNGGPNNEIVVETPLNEGPNNEIVVETPLNEGSGDALVTREDTTTMSIGVEVRSDVTAANETTVAETDGTGCVADAIACDVSGVAVLTEDCRNDEYGNVTIENDVTGTTEMTTGVSVAESDNDKMVDGVTTQYLNGNC